MRFLSPFLVSFSFLIWGSLVFHTSFFFPLPCWQITRSGNLYYISPSFPSLAGGPVEKHFCLFIGLSIHCGSDVWPRPWFPGACGDLTFLWKWVGSLLHLLCWGIVRYFPLYLFFAPSAKHYPPYCWFPPPNPPPECRRQARNIYCPILVSA